MGVNIIYKSENINSPSYFGHSFQLSLSNFHFDNPMKFTI